MKRVTAFFLFCLLLLVGCQPTPAVETVPPKDFDTLIEKAQTSPATVQVTLVPEAEEISAAAAEEADIDVEIDEFEDIVSAAEEEAAPDDKPSDEE